MLGGRHALPLRLEREASLRPWAVGPVAAGRGSMPADRGAQGEGGGRARGRPHDINFSVLFTRELARGQRGYTLSPIVPPWTNERARGRALTLAAQALEDRAEEMRAEAKRLVRELPPGSFARDIRTGKMLVVRQQGGETMLDEFTDRGMREAEESDWFFLDLVEEGK